MASVLLLAPPSVLLLEAALAAVGTVAAEVDVRLGELEEVVVGEADADESLLEVLLDVPLEADVDKEELVVELAELVVDVEDDSLFVTEAVAVAVAGASTEVTTVYND